MIGIIGGTGWLGSSIARALLESAFITPQELVISSRSDAPATLPGVAVTRDNQALVARCDTVILSVRPQDLGAVNIDASGKLLISLVAGVDMATLGAHTSCQRLVRAMPNAALELRTSYTPWLASEAVDDASRQYVQRLFETCGTADQVQREDDLNYLTALAGTGPSYPALLAQALYDNAIAHGLSEHIARRAVMGIVVHASQLIDEQRDFQTLLQTLIGYRGVSAAGIEGMRAGGLQASVDNGLHRALEVAGSALFTPTRS